MRLFTISSNGSLAKIVMTTDETGDDFVLLSAPEMDRLMDDLAHLRAGMTPPVTLDHTPTAWEVAPHWRMSRQPDQRVLSIRQSGKGWLSFILSDVEAERLATALTEV